MYFILALVSMLGYSLQGIWMTRIYRRTDALTASAFRGLALGVTMLPLLFFADFSALSSGSFYRLLFEAAFYAALANWSFAKASRHLPMGLAYAAAVGLQTVFVVVLDMIALRQPLSSSMLLSIGVIIGGNALCGIFRAGASPEGPAAPAAENWSRVPEPNTPLGFVFAVSYAVFVAATMLAVTKLSRTSNTYLAAYSWEFTIGVVAWAIAWGRWIIGRGIMPIVSRRDLREIWIGSSPTLIGTGCFTAALSMGSMAIANAVLSGMIVVTSIAAHFLYGERFTRLQWLGIWLVVLGVVGLRVFV